MADELDLAAHRQDTAISVLTDIDRKRDEFDRCLFAPNETPDPWTPESRFAQWLGRTCSPWTVVTVTEMQHRTLCYYGWVRSGEWSFVCKRCHPSAVDMPGTSYYQGELATGHASALTDADYDALDEDAALDRLADAIENECDTLLIGDDQ